MNYLLLFVLSTLTLCEANNFVCQFYDFSANSLAKYCENFQLAVPITNCTREIDAFDAFQVDQLKIGGCDSVTILDSVERFKSARKLDISHSSYKTLDWLDLGVARLETLNASHNELSNIKIFQQNASDSIVEIDLSYNQLKCIPPNTFDGARQLMRLHLAHNAIHSIVGGAFDGAVNLEFLNLDANRFWTIPIITNNKRLKAIHLNANPILTFACADVSMMSGISLHFSWKWALSFHGDGKCYPESMHVIRDNHDEGILVASDGTHEIHCNEQSFVNLTIFVAGHNSITNGGDLLQCLNPTVMQIDLSGTHIGKPNATVFQRFNRLSVLSLSTTMLTDFDFAMVKSDSLMKLDLSHNDLKFLRNVRLLEGFDSLEELSIAGNHIENTADLIQHLKPAITKLDVSGNPVGLINSITFEWLTELRQLNLSNTALSIDDMKPFEPLKNLGILDLSQNNLTNVNFTMLSVLHQLNQLNAAHCLIGNASDLIRNLQPSLQRLDLSGNMFDELDIQAFDALVQLKSLNLSNTNILSIDLNAFKILPNLQIFDISHNKLHELHFPVAATHRLSHLFLADNELMEIENFAKTYFTRLDTLTIAENQLSCKYLRRLKSEWIELNFADDLFDQKHHKNCQSSLHSISDFVNLTFNRVKFW